MTLSLENLSAYFFQTRINLAEGTVMVPVANTSGFFGEPTLGVEPLAGNVRGFQRFVKLVDAYPDARATEDNNLIDFFNFNSPFIMNLLAAGTFSGAGFQYFSDSERPSRSPLELEVSTHILTPENYPLVFLISNM